MSISTLREIYQDIPGVHTLTMRYGRDDSGKEIQIFEFDGKRIEINCVASVQEIGEAIKRAAS